MVEYLSNSFPIDRLASTFNEVADGLKSRYENDEDAWLKIVAEMKEKGLEVCDYEDESCDF